MENSIIKKFPTIACCGIDCGLCPTYYTNGPSKCPGCGGPNFSDKHPSCSILTCCTKNNGFETCADCDNYPCEKLKNWDKADSFVTHKVSFQNLYEIKQNGITNFIEKQILRIKILEMLLDSFNEGRSKSFFCLATTLLPINDLNNFVNKAKKNIEEKGISPEDIRSKAKIIREMLNNYAKNMNIEIKLRKNVK
ncbi:MAG: DUF3795 domain-containing protein [Candidatus Lokiarchaeota archaeon]|nr:DUF3795 domain-containing protein [Candidatus Lokiarchaeota archaeon]